MCKFLPRFNHSWLVDLDFHILDKLHVALKSHTEKLVMQVIKVFGLACVLSGVVLENLCQAVFFLFFYSP